MENLQNQKTSEPLNKNLVIICTTIIAVAIIISAVVLFKSNQSGNSANLGNNDMVQQNQDQNQSDDLGKFSSDDDPVLGDKNAPLTMIEFSDYECPFCKRHFTDVYPQIKKDYIDTGKLKLVYRDLIAVPSHNPLATSEAMAANCAREQGGDSAYFKYHDEIFKRTVSNGNGLQVSQLPAIAKDLGLNVSSFQSCLDSNKYKDEVNKDIADASRAGANGTPSFFVGKSSADGVVDGTIIVGAQPFAAFKTIIDKMLQ